MCPPLHNTCNQAMGTKELTDPTEAIHRHFYAQDAIDA